ncbi:MAG: CBS domain-containing protein [Archaeoglobaceae archaeon]
MRVVKAIDVGTREVFTLPRSSTIMNALKAMLKRGFRRIPVADAGTKRLEGIVSATDFINLFGGGEKFNFVSVKYSGNLAAAVNAEIEEIMERNVVTVEADATLGDAVETMFEKGVGGCPIVDDEDRVVGIITERDILRYLAKDRYYSEPVGKYATRKVVTIKPRDTIRDAMKIMIEKRLRRLPVIDDGLLVGMITVREILRYFGSGEAFKMLVSGNIKDAIDVSVSAILSKPDLLYYKEVLAFPPDVSISHVVRSMLEKGHGAALIVDGGKLEGIITERDLIKFMHELRS